MDARKHRVVLVDDDDNLRPLWKLLVESVNCEVVGQGRDGFDAVALFKKERPDLMLLDLSMPNKTGEEALRDIRWEFPSARIVVLTAKADSATVLRCIAAGADGYILKDTPFAQLKATITGILAKGLKTP